MVKTGIKLGVLLILLLAIKVNAFGKTIIKQSLDSIVSGRSKNIYSYDDKGNNILNAGYYWNDENNSWTGDYKHEYAFDNNGNQILLIYYYWDNTSNNWKGNRKNESTYDNDGRKLNISYNWDNTTNDWKTVSKSEQVFDLSYSKTDLTVPVFLYYDFWHERTCVYNYDNMLLEEISYTQSGTDWVQSGIATRYYWSRKSIETGVAT